MKMRSVMQRSYGSVAKVNIPRSLFNRSHGYKTTLQADKLVPFYVDEALPGDDFSLKVTAFARMVTPVVPIMDNIWMDFFFFFCPNRLIWTNFVRQMGEQDNPGESTSYTTPQCSAPGGSGYAIMSLQDYMGIPTGMPNIVVNNLAQRAYNLTFNQWFRDENLQNSVTVDKGDGPDTASNYIILNRGKRGDYFTTCLPWPQKATAVNIPLSSALTVTRVSNAAGWKFYDQGTNTPSGVIAAGLLQANASSELNDGTTNYSFDPVGGLKVDASAAGTISSLRQAVALQQLYERDARGGTRYTEVCRAHFGVVSPDARLQRVEYLGGGSVPVIISPIAQNSATGATGTPQGNLAAIGTSVAHGIGFSKGFTEHGIVLGLVNIRCDITYQQGLDRMWSRSTRADYFWPDLAHISEQSVLNKEIYYQDSATPDNAVFGYCERYAEYRSKKSMITGKFRSTAAGTLDVWHLAVKYTSLPALDATWIQSSTPISRVVAVPSEPPFQFDAYLNLKCARPIPVFGNPGLLRF